MIDRSAQMQDQKKGLGIHIVLSFDKGIADMYRHLCITMMHRIRKSGLFGASEYDLDNIGIIIRAC